MRNRRIPLLALGVGLSAVFLYLALRGLDWRALGQTLLGVRMGSLTLCVAMIALGVVLRGLRWSLIAGRAAQAIVPFVRATNLGILGNQVLPARLGEVVRIVALKRILKSGLSESVGSSLIDRLFDAVYLFLSAWLVSTLMAKALLPQGWLLGLGGALAVLCAGLVVVRTRRFHAWVASWSERYLHRWSLRPDAFVQAFNGMVERLTRWRSATVVIAVAALVWLADYLAVLAALWSIGLDLPPVAPLLLWVMLAAGSALPSAPGFVGIYQLAAVLALAAYGVPAHQAIAVSLVLQGVALLVSFVGAGNEAMRLWSTASNYSATNET